MNTKKIILICLIAIMATCVLCGNLMLKNTINPSNCKNITLADGTTLAIPSEFTISKPFSNHIEEDGFYYTNTQLESKDYGWVHIEYKNDPVETMAHGSNSTKATDSDNDGVYEFDVFDGSGHRVMRITGSNPAIVESIGRSVKFNINETIKPVDNTSKVNTTVEKISNDKNQQANDNQQQNTANNKENEQTTYIGKDGKTHSMSEAYSVDYSSGDLNTINEQRRERGMSEISA